MGSPVVIVSFGAGLDGAAVGRVHTGASLDAPCAASCAGRSTRARALAAVAIRARHPGSRLLFSGRGVVPDRVTEAEAMRGVAIGAGVPAGDISVEPAGRDTAQSVARCAQMLRRDAPGARVIAVSGERHLWRIARHFRAYGIIAETEATHTALDDPSVDRADTGPRARLDNFLLRVLCLVDARGRIPSWIVRNRP